MKTKAIHRFAAALTLSALLGLMLVHTGCVAVAAGAGAGAAVAYVRGELEATLDSEFEKTVAATNTAIEQLKFAKVSQRTDALIGTIVARNADDKKIEVRLETVSSRVTKVRIRVGVFGDEALSMAVLDRIKTNL